jgi:phosphoribosyl-AMP cyclohydrolase / phosphoribosyl-ATP pyrophosphohydrolase
MKNRDSTKARSGSGDTDRRIRTAADLDALRFATPSGAGDARALLPVVTQDGETGDVLMLAWVDREALERTLESGEMHYWSRSRGELWHKGATSGNTQRLRSLHADCDGDTVLALVDPAGPACHTDETTCFGRTGAGPGRASRGGATDEPPAAAPAPPPAGADAWLTDLWQTLEARTGDRPEGSYTTRLLEDENLRLKKLGEETAELIHALAKGDGERIPEEAADLLYHLLVALLAAGHSIDDVGEVLAHRRR